MKKNNKNSKTKNSKNTNIKRILKKDSNLKIYEVLAFIILTAAICIFSTVLIMNETFNNNKNLTISSKTKKEFSEVEEVYNIINKSYYKKVDKSKLIEGAIDGMLKSLDDPHTSFFTKEQTEQFKTEMNGSYEGIGAEISVDKDGNIIVYSVFKKSPANESGLKYGDIILEVNGVKIENMTTEKVVSLIKDEKKPIANIKINRDGKELEFNIKKRIIEIESVESKVLNKNNKKIGYIIINSFANNTFNQFENQLKEIESENINGLIIDVRSNTGGYLHSVTNILDILVSKGNVMYQIADKNKTTKYSSSSSESRNYPIVVIVDGSSASASEILAISLKENSNALIIGTNSYGKGTVQTTQNLSTGAMFKYTIQKWLSPNGNFIDKKGIKPDYEIELSEDFYNNPTEENDNQLQKAIEVITRN